jgi:hypothetical protein
MRLPDCHARYDNRIAQRGHFLHNVAREQHAAAFLLESSDDGAYGTRAHDVEAIGRLIEQDVLRVMHERASEAHFGALAVGEARRPAICDRIHVEEIEQLLRPLSE